jgi:hypothetical protein
MAEKWSQETRTSSYLTGAAQHGSRGRTAGRGSKHRRAGSAGLLGAEMTLAPGLLSFVRIVVADPDRALQRADAPDERDRRTLDRRMPPRAPGSHPRLEPAHLRRILGEYATHHNQHRPHRSLHGAAPLKPLPQPVDLDQYRVRRHTSVGGTINEYRLVA